jgi:hypothetical protein
MKISNFSVRCLVVSSAVVFIYCAVAGTLAQDAIKDILLLTFGAILGRGRQETDKPDKPVP